MEGPIVDNYRLELSEDGEGLYLSGLVVPYNEVWEPKSQPHLGEAFAPTALTKTLQERGSDIRLYSLHRGKDSKTHQPIGIATQWDNTDRGAYATFKLARTTAAQDAKALIADKIVTGLSAGFDSVKHTVLRRGNRQVIRHDDIELDHVALVESPAYKSAQVLAVRSDDDCASIDDWLIEGGKPFDRLKAARDYMARL